METFLENLKTAFSDSQYRLCMENRKTDSAYRRLETEYNRVFNKIKSKLGKDRSLMLELEELDGAKDSIDEDCIYLQGMMDCVTLLKLINLL